MIDLLLHRFSDHKHSKAIATPADTTSYGDLLTLYAAAKAFLDAHCIHAGDVVSLEADFSPTSIAMLCALIANRTIVVPLSPTNATHTDTYRQIAQIQYRISIGSDGTRLEKLIGSVSAPLLLSLGQRGSPGLVLFSSGSTGESKGVVHDFNKLLAKFKTPRPAKTTLTFLLFDHIGGINTLFHILSNGGCIVTVRDRTPESIARAIEAFKVQVLPTTPSFLNLLLLSEAYKHFDLSSLELISYGTEVMPQSTLARLNEEFPRIAFLQTYGLSELGILRTKSESSESLWVKVGGEGYETRIRNGLLEIKADSAMLGYLNAPSPFTDDGWFQTGDMVEVKGDFFRFMGRRSEIINIGGEKVYPAEVESLLLQIPCIEDVVVSAEPHPLLGNIVKATIVVAEQQPLPVLRKLIRDFCKDKMPRYKIPQKLVIADKSLIGSRQKRKRTL